MDCLNQGDLNLADGVSLLFADWFERLLRRRAPRKDTEVNTKIIHRSTGVDTLELICRIASEEGKRVLFFGGADDVAEKAAEQMRKRYPGLIIKGLNPGSIEMVFPPTTPQPLLGEEGRHDAGETRRRGASLSADVLDEIRAFAPDVLAVALGQKKQEHIICSCLKDLPSVKIAIGVGGALDYLSGSVPRAPKWMRHIGLEWLYRLIQQPQRIGRIFNAVIVFPFTVIWARIKA